ALAIKHARGDAQVFAVDRSPDAVEVARSNADRLKLDVDIRPGDLLAPVRADAPFDLVASNPPYIPTAELPSLPAEVKKEPTLALDGGPDGLAVIRPLLAQARDLLKPDGSIILELAAGQAPRVLDLMRELGYADPQTRKDLSGIDRVVFASK